jgi:hypothetical protein
MKKLLLILAVSALLLASALAAMALGPAPSWDLTQGAAASCNAASNIALPGVDINVPAPLVASEQGVLSAPGSPDLGNTIDSFFTGVGTFSFTVFLNSPLALPPNTPLTLSVTTYNGPNFTGGAFYNSTITWDCTTGAVLSVSSGVILDDCPYPLPSGSVVGEAPLGAQVYWGPSANKLSPGVILNPGTYHVVGVDETGEFSQVWLACGSPLLWVRSETLQPSFQPPQNGAPLPTRVVS